MDVLNDLTIDLVAGVMVLREYAARAQSQPMPPELVVSVKRLCFSHFVLNLNKYIEFWKRYKAVVPLETQETMKQQIKSLEKRNVMAFRNKYIGHIWEDDHKRPLVHSEILARVEEICENDLNGFHNWINTPNGNAFPATRIGVIDRTRNILIQEFRIEANEIIER